uniref:Uncharacterized protein n=1 Tax=Steinernema glaseri TaxID=37863 RepID=A0A1I8AFE1_9BILA
MPSWNCSTEFDNIQVTASRPSNVPELPPVFEAPFSIEMKPSLARGNSLCFYTACAWLWCLACSSAIAVIAINAYFLVD